MFKKKWVKYVLIVGVALIIFYQGVKPFSADMKTLWEKLTPETTTEQEE